MKPLSRITQFVLEQAEDQPLRRREELYRDLGAIAPTAMAAKVYHAMADDLARIERNHRQLVLDLRSSANVGGES